MTFPLNTVVLGDCLEVLRTLPDASVDAVVTDPPAGVSFMGREWDTDKGGRLAWVGWMTDVMRECLRVLKPGGHSLVWSLPRTSHWTGSAIEDAGFEVRDCIHHIFGQGFPKSLNIGKAIDRMAGAEREVVGPYTTPEGGQVLSTYNNWQAEALEEGTQGRRVPMVTAPATEAAKRWDGWGTALKPAVETWWLCRKPIEAANVASQVLATGTGAINIDGTRVGYAKGEVDFDRQQRQQRSEGSIEGAFGAAALIGKEIPTYKHEGRWPSNLVLSHSPDCKRVGTKTVENVGGASSGGTAFGQGSGWNPHNNRVTEIDRTPDEVPVYECAEGCPVAVMDRQSSEVTGGASRFFNVFEPFIYTGKASKADKNDGLDDLPARAQHRIEEQTVSTQSNRRCRKCGLVKFGKPFCECEEPEWEETTGSKSGNFHPTVKSQALMRHLVRLVCPKGGIVLDPFAGSGSTLVAAVTEGMKFVGIEREPEYHTIAKARTDAVLEREGAAARQHEAFDLMSDLEQE